MGLTDGLSGVRQDLSENDLGRDTSISLAVGDALRINTGLRTLLLARMISRFNHARVAVSAGRF